MTPWVLRLLIANVAVYLVVPPQSPLYQMLAFVPAWVLRQPWSIVTYMFLHAGLMHILFNMIGLYFFGPRLEARIGSRDFILLYLLSGVVGALLSFFLTPGAAIVGASGAVFGVLYGFAHYWPHERIYIWGVLPVPARGMVLGLAALSIWFGISGGSAGIAHFAHLGGFAGGWGYLKIRERRSTAFQRKATAGRSSPVDKVTGKTAREEKKWDRIDVDSLHEINRSEVERIRSKIDEEGKGSLTPDERAFMNRMAG
ncbi:MAG: rhomboid family intramembrane serine protease [Longimicrobiales bacterium]|nr:rhomboid family intramembrane serine protease [Longimicrobiales bacterium]